ncbi:MAG: DUF1552 domain-containing protein [Myxococcota bacterium]
MNIDRRQLLKTAGGAALALPSMSSLNAFAQSGAPKVPKLLIYYLPNGRRRPVNAQGAVSDNWWVPDLVDGRLEFPPVVSALQPYADRALAFVDLDNTAARNSPGAAHAAGTGTCLTGIRIRSLGNPALGTSVDQLIAEAIGRDSRFPSLVWSAGEPGPCDVGGSSCALTQSISWTGASSPIVAVNNAQVAFNRLFDESIDGLRGAAGAIRRRSVLSLIASHRSDAHRFRQRLSTEDRIKFDGYLNSLEELENSFQSPPSTCSAVRDQPARQLPYEQRVRAFHELMKLALQCEQTSVITFMIEYGLSPRVHGFLNADGGHHSLSHNVSPSGLQRLRSIETWHAEMLFDLLNRLASTPTSGPRNLLDDTLVVVMPSMGHGNTHDHSRICPILFGATDWFQTTGQRYEARQAPLSNFHATLLRGFGLEGTYGVNGAIFGEDGNSVLPGVIQ